MTIQVIELTVNNIRLYRQDYMKCLADGFNAPGICDYDFYLMFRTKKSQGHIMLGSLSETSKMVSIATVIPECKFLHNCSTILHVEDVCTQVEYRRLGYSRAIFEEVYRIAKEKEAYKVILDCSDDNVEFYKSLGFFKYENCMRRNT
jgi:GNAT superfamily N-acetyltransferase